MRYLPNRAQCRVPAPKITHYLLRETHPKGGPKASFFIRFGFSPGHWQILRDALILHAAEQPVKSSENYTWEAGGLRGTGVKYTIEGPLTCPDGRRPRIRSVWKIENDPFPSLVTPVPLR